jgi:hypothetical protein
VPLDESRTVTFPAYVHGSPLITQRRYRTWAASRRGTGFICVKCHSHLSDVWQRVVGLQIRPLG